MTSGSTPPPDLPPDSGISYNPARDERVGALFPPRPAANAANQTRWVVSQIGPAGPDGGPDADHAQPPQPNQYLLRHIIGRGGFGEVWEAVQTSLGRLVAIKRLRPDLAETAADSSITARRLELSFRQEALTAGNLDHPNIVPIHDLGLDEDGNALLAMKLVRGVPWEHQIRDDYVRMTELDFLSRHLPVLVDVAQAVAFAHSRGIVHRDLKPSQVMVGEFGETMLMDWGLALAFDPKLAYSATGGADSVLNLPTTENATNPAGTPAYMAPEQTESNARNIGPWTDVYLLGGMLYYLLTGTHPHFTSNSTEAFARAAMGEFTNPFERTPNRRIPPELERLCAQAMAADRRARLGSAAQFVQRLQDYLSGASRRRDAENFARQAMEKLSQTGAGYEELSECASLFTKALASWPDHPEWPGMMAMAYERHIRLAIDHGDLVLARLLADRLANADRKGQLVKEIDERQRRARRQVYQRRAYLGTAAFLAFWVLWAVYSLRLAKADQRLALQQVLAETQRAALLAQINQLGRDETDLARRLGAILPMPQRIGVQDDEALTVEEQEALKPLLAERDKLRARRKQIQPANSLIGLPPEPFELRLANANALALGSKDHDKALQAFREYGQAVLQDVQSPEPYIGMAITAARTGHPTSATTILKNAAELALRRYGSEHRSYAHVLALQGEAARSLDDSSEDFVKYYRDSAQILFDDWTGVSLSLSEQLRVLGDHDEALKITSATLELQQQLVAHGNGPRLARTHRLLGEVYLVMGSYKPALAEFRAGLEALGTEGKVVDPADEAILWSGVGRALEAMSQFSEAEIAQRKAYDLRVGIGGPDTPEAATYLGNLAVNAMNRGDLAEAEKLFLETLAIHERTLGGQHPDVFMDMNNLASVYFRQVRIPEALELMERVLVGERAAYGPEHPRVAQTLHNLGEVMIDNGKAAEAEAVLRESVELRLKGLGSDHPLTAASHTSLARAMSRQEKYEEAEEEYREALRIMRKTLGPNNVQLAALLNNLALNLGRQNRIDEATPLLEEALAICQASVGEQHQFTATAYDNVARNMTERGLLRDALPLSQKSLQIRLEVVGPDHGDTITSLMNTGSLQLELGNVEEAERLCRQAFGTAVRVFGIDHYRTAFAASNYGRVMVELGDDEQALRLLAITARVRAGQQGEKALSTLTAVRQVSQRLRDTGRKAEWNELLGWIHSSVQPFDEPITLAQAEVLVWVCGALEDDATDEEAAELLPLLIYHRDKAFPDSRKINGLDALEAYLPLQLWIARGCLAMEPPRMEEAIALVKRAQLLAHDGGLNDEHPNRSKYLDPLSQRAGLPPPNLATGPSGWKWPMKVSELNTLLDAVAPAPDLSFIERPAKVEAMLDERLPVVGFERVKEILEEIPMPEGVD